jgi:hypothetical protein
VQKTTLLIVLSTVAVVAAAGVAATLIAGSGREHQVRYEIESSSGNANGILWSIDNRLFDKKMPAAGESTVRTPWSATVRFTRPDQLAQLTTEVADGTATCRIFLDGKKADEKTSGREATCHARFSW